MNNHPADLRRLPVDKLHHGQIITPENARRFDEIDAILMDLEQQLLTGTGVEKIESPDAGSKIPIIIEGEIVQGANENCHSDYQNGAGDELVQKIGLLE